MKFSVQIAWRLPVSTCLTTLASVVMPSHNATLSLPRTRTGTGPVS